MLFAQTPFAQLHGAIRVASGWLVVRLGCLKRCASATHAKVKHVVFVAKGVCGVTSRCGAEMSRCPMSQDKGEVVCHGVSQAGMCGRLEFALGAGAMGLACAHETNVRCCECVARDARRAAVRLCRVGRVYVCMTSEAENALSVTFPQ